ncbi:MAG: TRAP transporter small permease subunit [Gammaproteobacteria bacterium]|nr:TRAP transporter small permease subunit [Gammaproteobacteria bacterium]
MSSSSPADWLERLSVFIGRTVAWGVAAMTAVMFLVVVLRYFLGMGSIALQESVIYFHSLVFMLGLAWTLADDQHVRVDILYQRWSERTRAWIDLAGVLLLLLPVCVVIIATSIPYVADSWQVSETSREAGGLPFIYLLKTLIPVAGTLLALQGVAMGLRALVIIRGRV